jgi:hypothetical protein
VPLPALETVEPLPDAAVILELAVGQSLRTRILGYSVGRLRITPRDGRLPHDVLTVRLQVPPEDKRSVPHYWDVTGRKLCTALWPYLESGAFVGKVFTFTKISAPPVGDYTLSVVPETT